MPVQVDYHHQQMQNYPPPPSPPYHSQYPIPHNNTAPFMMNQQQNIKIQPSFSTPIIGSNTQGPQQHHKSWPDMFFGSRDLFDTLPIRRASVTSTQHAFEFIPNSTSTSSSSSATITSSFASNFNGAVPFIEQQQPQKKNVGIINSK